ncbi:isoprenylcysteine carboxyl methyltransferase family protein [Bacillus pinisoli]|uniref:isoprenylcysteine carboxyl methyltransferase family protein n=1 Tax=Bacillus pinisoli TaxID=2901866 RepID=UPI001FF56960
MFFFTFFAFIVLQRLSELTIAKRNEKWMKSNGAIEVGQDHYPLMVLLHSSFFIAVLLEVVFLQTELSPIWPALVTVFALTQLLRIWSLATLGRYWNTKIIVMPNAKIVKNGPYKFLRHPNYVIVVVEILLIPILFQAYWTAVIFSLLNLWMLSVRIPLEEKALLSQTDYEEKFQKISRFSPIRLK